MPHIGPYLFIDNDPNLFNSINNCGIHQSRKKQQIILEYSRSGPNMFNFYILCILHYVPSDIFEVEREAYQLVSYIFLRLEGKIVLPFFHDINGASIHKCFRFPIVLFRHTADGFEPKRQHYLCVLRSISLYCHLFHATDSDEQEPALLGGAEVSDDHQAIRKWSAAVDFSVSCSREAHKFIDL